MERHYPYVLIGGGMAADAAARGIREIDPDRSIALIGREPDPPYNRPPLSKGLWKTSPRPMPLSRIWRGTAGLGVELLLGRSIVRLDLSQKTIEDDQGGEITFERLLIATGGDPIRLGDPHERVIYFRSLEDYRRLRALTETEQDFLIIGGGFIGSEIAASLANLGKTVTMVFPEPAICARVLPEPAALHLNDVYRQRGVRVVTGAMVSKVVPDKHGVTVLTGTETLRASAVVAGLGIRPNTELAKDAGLVTGNGIHVDESLRTGHPDVFAAGDVVNFFNPVLGQRMRVEHEENANVTGRLAGLGMAGEPAPYTILPSVYSTLFDISYDAVGDLDPRMGTIIDWQEPFQKGTVYYLKEGQVRGVLLWNIGRGLDEARRLIAEPGPFRTIEDLRAGASFYG